MKTIPFEQTKKISESMIKHYDRLGRTGKQKTEKEKDEWIFDDGAGWI